MAINLFHHPVPGKTRFCLRGVWQIHEVKFCVEEQSLRDAGEKQVSLSAFYASAGEWLSCLSYSQSSTGGHYTSESGAPACAVTLIILEPKVQVGLLAMHQAINMSHGDGSTALPLSPGIVD